LCIVNSGNLMTSGPHLDPAAIQALRDLSPEGDEEFLRELVTIYLADTPKQLAQLDEALARQDAAQLVRSAHTIKGSSGNFGARELAQVAHQIESHGKSGNLAAAATEVPALKAQFALVAAELRRIAGT
jgi:histidine phosphotransfer protein HptB